MYYTASSLDGCIIDEGASLDWLTSRAIDPEGPFGIEPFMRRIDALVMGAGTYRWIAALGAGSPVLPIRSEWTLVESGANGDFVCARGRRM